MVWYSIGCAGWAFTIVWDDFTAFSKHVSPGGCSTSQSIVLLSFFEVRFNENHASGHFAIYSKIWLHREYLALEETNVTCCLSQSNNKEKTASCSRPLSKRRYGSGSSVLTWLKALQKPTLRGIWFRYMQICHINLPPSLGYSAEGLKKDYSTYFENLSTLVEGFSFDFYRRGNASWRATCSCTVSNPKKGRACVCCSYQ